MDMEAPERTRAGASRLSDKDVLLVEDEPGDREKYATWLTAAGARVDEVGTLEAARRALCSRRFDLLVTDRLLPDGDAFEWFRAERRRQARMPPCLVLSGHLDEKMYRSIYEEGAVPLPKAHLLHPDVLIAAVGSAFRFAGATSADRGHEAIFSHPLSIGYGDERTKA